MRLPSSLFVLFFLSVLLSSCDFQCKVNSDPKKEATGKMPEVKDGAILYNGIKLTTNHIKVKKAYLVFENGERVPEGNFIDFKTPVKLLILIDSGWVVQNGKVKLQGAEKVVMEGGRVILNEDDLFASYPDGVSEADSKIIGFTVTLTLPPNAPPTSFLVSFKAADKEGDGVIEGEYKLFSK